MKHKPPEEHTGNTSALIELLSRYVSRNKTEKIREVLQWRTRYITLVIEDIHKPHNAGATLRTCDCLGVQDIHIIENTTPFSINDDVTQGASKWITLHRHRNKNTDNTAACLQALRKNGYRLVAMTPNTGGLAPGDIPLDSKLAFLFGNEESGLSRPALQAADLRVKLPMYGFSQSYNISVSVAVLLSGMIRKLHESNAAWQLTETEKRDITLSWYRKIVRRSDLIEKNCLENTARPQPAGAKPLP